MILLHFRSLENLLITLLGHIPVDLRRAVRGERRFPPGAGKVRVRAGRAPAQERLEKRRARRQAKLK